VGALLDVEEEIEAANKEKPNVERKENINA
jgi:hypothetical protein